MRDLELSDRRRLLAIARQAIEAVLCPELRFEPDPSSLSIALRDPSAAFVTLREHGDVRGCIGRLRFETPLWVNVRDAAVSAAFDDPRFLPLVESELPLVELEVSVLDPPVPIADPAAFEPGRHGIIVERAGRMALLLPQVATEMGWGRDEMLRAVCQKAWLPSSAWREKSTRLSVFESTCFSERDVSLGAEAALPGRRTESR